MSEQHTKEPWGFVRIDISADDWQACELWPADRDGEPIATHICNEVDARRICACVNACAGVHDNYLNAVYEEGGAEKFFKEREIFKQQRNELLAAAKNLRDVKGRYNTEIAMKRLIEAINKVEAGQ